MNTKTFASTKDMTYEEWQETRNKGIGGSDAGAIAGVNTFKSAMSVYLDKIGEGEKIEENEFMYWGNILEDVVATEFSKRTGLKTQRKNAILQHPEHEWMLANVDRLIKDPENGWGILECKTTSEYNKKQWEEENLPDSYYLQMMHYLAVTDLQYAYIAVLIGGNKFKYYKVERDQEVIDYLIGIEKNFWEENILKHIPPTPDGSSNATFLLNKMYPGGDQEVIKIEDLTAIETLKQLEEIKEEEKKVKKEKERLEQVIKMQLGDHEIGFIGDHKISWKKSVTNRIDTKKLKEEKPEIYEAYLKSSEQRRFKI